MDSPPTSALKGMDQVLATPDGHRARRKHQGAQWTHHHQQRHCRDRLRPWLPLMAIVHHEDTREGNGLTTTNNTAAGDGSDSGYL